MMTAPTTSTTPSTVVAVIAVVLLSVAAVPSANGAAPAMCPVANSGKSPRDGTPARMTWTNHLP